MTGEAENPRDDILWTRFIRRTRRLRIFML